MKNELIDRDKEILDEYVRVSKTIDNIKSKIENYKNSVNELLKKAKTEKEQDEIIEKYRNDMMKIKNDKNITRRFKLLKQKQKNLKNLLLPSINNDADIIINLMKGKYTDDDYISLNKGKLDDFEYDIILHKIQKNLE